MIAADDDGDIALLHRTLHRARQAAQAGQRIGQRFFLGVQLGMVAEEFQPQRSAPHGFHAAVAQGRHAGMGAQLVRPVFGAEIAAAPAAVETYHFHVEDAVGHKVM